ncbi:GNAT family N-acetyltransferase [Microbaculum marinum]|uniref:GNAT family N-acetyltransferase n=1 Tax=Microbaculum marinum TaxID=1764581 RepID=A0AAW9RXL6_9HYPH
MTQLVLEGYTDLPADRVAAVATFLEMLEPPGSTPSAPSRRPDLALNRVDDLDPGAYRDLFRRVGTEYLWSSRLRLDDAALLDILRDPAVEVYLPASGDGPVGLLELDFRDMPSAEIAFFGLVPEAIGGGAGRWLMDRALELSWRDGVDRVWLHTCTFDHPAALAFYRRSGFVPYARKIEAFPDPRIDGLLPRDAAPHVPLIGN